MRKLLILLTVLSQVTFVTVAAPKGKAKHVVVIVWDGMRPDFINEDNTPTLYKMMREGVWFENHHPVYMSATEVNGTAIATGAYPAHDGIVGNREFRPDIDPLKTFHTEEIDMVRKGDDVMHGKYILVPTLAELLRQKGMKTAIAGAKPIALLHDRAERTNAEASPVLFAGRTLPPGLSNTITELYGAFPGSNDVTLTRNDWTTEALIEPMWANGVPEYSLLWMNEPDAAQHATGPGSAKSLAAIKNADDNLARVLHALEVKGVRNETDVLLISDHGFSTVLSLVDLADALTNAGFKASREFKTPPNKGDILVSGNGGSVLLYVTGHDPKSIKDLVAFLQGWSYTGVIFTKQALEGTFTLAQGHLDSPTAPDVMVSMRWKPERNEAGAPGMLICDLCPYGPGQGMHGSLSPFEMHNTFIAAGPDFLSGVVDPIPTGNVDIAPTVLWILGIKQPRAMDGRVVTEGLVVGEDTAIKSFSPMHLEATRELEKVIWHQYLNFTKVNGVTYFDEGNGIQTPK